MDNIQENSTPKEQSSQSQVKNMIKVDQEILDSLKKYYEGEKLDLVKRQLDTLCFVLTHTEQRYQYSKDYREAMDTIMGLIVAGKFL